jgi:hypothetical protein
MAVVAMFIVRFTAQRLPLVAAKSEEVRVERFVLAEL